MADELSNLNWTRAFWRVSTIEEQMADFANLWDLVPEVELSDMVDSIT